VSLLQSDIAELTREEKGEEENGSLVGVKKEMEAVMGTAAEAGQAGEAKDGFIWMWRWTNN